MNKKNDKEVIIFNIFLKYIRLQHNFFLLVKLLDILIRDMDIKYCNYLDKSNYLLFDIQYLRLDSEIYFATDLRVKNRQYQEMGLYVYIYMCFHAYQYENLPIHFKNNFIITAVLLIYAALFQIFAGIYGGISLKSANKTDTGIYIYAIIMAILMIIAIPYLYFQMKTINFKFNLYLDDPVRLAVTEKKREKYIKRRQRHEQMRAES